ncbi:MAG: hypothetical protein MUO23_07030 [Anaerolineales bacterium]|nr:hypothetical protein [Anaerolineales bacterium]
MTWVEDGVYAAGGSHVPATWATFAGQTGIRVVLHLRPKAPEAFLGPEPRAFLWLDVSDEAQADVDLRLQAGRFVQQWVASEERVLLHSSLGRHRVRWAYVAYRICSGQSVQAALRAAEQRPWQAPYHTDRLAWEVFAAQMATSRSRPASGSGGDDHAV